MKISVDGGMYTDSELITIRDRISNLRGMAVFGDSMFIRFLSHIQGQICLAIEERKQVSKFSVVCSKCGKGMF